ncbi:MAG TPA: pilus assembly protein CpaE [Propionicimonas sp.]|nr:pilus assembly protein CpaE [Propionicimonas sp.]
MISHEQGRQLRLLVAWEPASGDRFVIPGTDLDEVFVIAEMTIEAQDVPGGQIIKFNGTTEWALDSIAAEKVLWLPREDQLRTLLSYAFVRLEVVGDGYAVELTDGTRHVDIDAERAYARAVIAWLGRR